MEEQAEEIKVQKEHKNAFGDFMEICESIVTSIFVVLLIFTFICRPVTVDGTSMNPNAAKRRQTDHDDFFLYSKIRRYCNC
mgnify:CR=1 FL=1